MVQSGNVDGIRRIGSSLILESDTSIRHYFALEQGKQIGDYLFLVNGIELYPQNKGNLYYIEISDLSAALLDDCYSVLIKPRTGEGEYVLSYSAFSYVYSAITSQSSTDKLKTLCYYIYMYARAAEEYVR